MKRIVAIIIVALAAAGVAQAADLTTNPNPANPPTGSPYTPDAPNITQSNDPTTVEAATGVACTDQVTIADNNFLRRFFLSADHGIVVQYNVTSVDFGVESATGTNAIAEMITYSIPSGAAFTYANMTQLGSASRTLADGTALSVENWVVGGSIVDPVAEDLVVNMYWPDSDTWLGFPGANTSGESQPSYLSSIACGLADPTTFAGIGFPDVALVVTVNGDEQVVPTPTPPPPSGALNPVPALSSYGIVAMVLMIVGIAVLLMWRRN